MSYTERNLTREDTESLTMVAFRVFLYNLCYNENSKDMSDNHESKKWYNKNALETNKCGKNDILEPFLSKFNILI